MKDITTIASLIDSGMKEFIFKNPNNKNQEDCESYTLGKLMRETKGHINPSLVIQMIKLHRTPMEKAGFLMEC